MKIIFILVFAMYSYCICAQTVQSSNQKDSLMLKSKKQKTAGWIVMGTGIGLAGAGFIVNAKEFVSGLGSIFSETNYISATGKVLVITGIAVIGTGTYLLINARKTKKRAMSISLNTNAVLLPATGNLTYSLQPAIKLTIPLNRK